MFVGKHLPSAWAGDEIANRVSVPTGDDSKHPTTEQEISHLKACPQWGVQ